MNSDSYKIIISLSHHRIAFEYWLRDGENKLVPMPNMTWPAPLAFYCSQTGIEIGEGALRAVHSGTSNAFDDYFDRLAKDETYYYGGQTKPLRYLLLDAAESIFADFFKTVLLSSKGTLNDNRANMPITIVCESDIAPNERALLTNLFKDSGYNRSKVVEYNSFIENYIRSSFVRDNDCDNALVAWTEGTDLTFTLFGLNQRSERRQACFSGLGVDPRLDYVKNLIWDRIKGQNPWLMYDNEEESITRAASDFLNSTSPLISETITLSDGLAYHYSLSRTVIDNLQCNEGTTIRKKLEAFLKDNGIVNRNKTLLLLRGVAAGNIFFEQTLCQGFTNTVRSDRRLRSNTMNQLIADPNPVVVQDPNTGTTQQIPIEQPEKPAETFDAPTEQPKTKEIDERRLKELKRKWREVNAESSGMARDGRKAEAIKRLLAFKAECEEELGTADLIKDIDDKLSALGQSTDKETKAPEKKPEHKESEPPKATIDPAKVKGLEREWREIRATAKGKARGGNPGDAAKILNDFIGRISKVSGTEALMANVQAELDALGPTPEAPKPASVRPAPAKPQPQSKPVETDKGEQLIAAGKLKEARDWYRAAGNSSKARTLTDLIRSQKGVELRKSSLEECRRTRNADQIKRIISELQEYINLCEQTKYDCAEYKKLLSEYKKLIK